MKKEIRRKARRIPVRRAACLCACLLALGLASCGKGGQDSTPSGTAQPESQSSQASAPSGEESQGSSADASGTQPGGAVSAGEGWSAEMEDLKTAVTEALGADDYWPDMALEPDMLQSLVSVGPDLYDDYMAEMPRMSAQVDTLIIVKAKEGKVKEAEDALNAYRDRLVADTMQYPMNLGKIQASRVDTVGSYVIFCQLGGDVDKELESGDEAVLAACQKDNELAVKAISDRLGGG